MAITILPREIGIAENIGNAVGGGIGDLLSGLAEGKTKQLRKKEFEKAGLPGFLALLDPRVQSAYLRNQGAANSSVAATQREQQRQKIPFFKGLEAATAPAEKLIGDIQGARNALKNVSAVGPGLGHLPAVSEDASLLDSHLAQILLNKSALEQTAGQRGTNLFLNLQKLAKPSRSMPRKALEKRLNDLEQEAKKVLSRQKIYADLTENNADENLSSKQLESLITNASKVYETLPDPSEYQEGDIGEESGYQFELKNGDWVFLGKAQ